MLLSSTAAARLRGALGWVDNVTEFDGVDAAPVPTALVAVTVNVYASPFVRPVTVIGEEVPVAEYVSVLSVTVYPVIAEPPSLEGVVKEIIA
jgi:hypothetical protein